MHFISSGAWVVEYTCSNVADNKTAALSGEVFLFKREVIIINYS
jgi:hypothetical protein